jgi:hypothetical protein
MNSSDLESILALPESERPFGYEALVQTHQPRGEYDTIRDAVADLPDEILKHVIEVAKESQELQTKPTNAPEIRAQSYLANNLAAMLQEISKREGLEANPDFREAYLQFRKAGELAHDVNPLFASAAFNRAGYIAQSIASDFHRQGVRGKFERWEKRAYDLAGKGSFLAERVWRRSDDDAESQRHYALQITFKTHMQMARIASVLARQGVGQTTDWLKRAKKHLELAEEELPYVRKIEVNSDNKFESAATNVARRMVDFSRRSRHASVAYTALDTVKIAYAHASTPEAKYGFQLNRAEVLKRIGLQIKSTSMLERSLEDYEEAIAFYEANPELMNPDIMEKKLDEREYVKSKLQQHL